MNESSNETEEPSEESFLQEEPRLKPKGILYERIKRKDAVWALTLAILCVITSFVFWWSPYADLLWASKSTVQDGEYWRLLSALFTHADLEHLLANMPLFVIFGWLLRSYFGTLAFPISGLVLGVLTNLMTLYFYPPHVRLIGASGIVYGLVGLWIAFYVKYEVRHGLRMKIFRVLGFSLVLIFPASYNPSTSYLAHAFGFAFGILIAIVLILSGVYDRKQKALQETQVS